MLMRNFADTERSVQCATPTITPYLLVNFAHEVRTPLNAILGFARLLEQRPDRADYAQAIGVASQRLELALASFMDLLRLASDPGSLAPVRTTPVEIVDVAMRAVAGCLEAQGVRLETCGLADASIEADPHYLSSAIAAAIGGIVSSLRTSDILAVGSATGDGVALWLEWRIEPDAFAAAQTTLSGSSALKDADLTAKDAPNIELRIARLLIEAQGGSVDLAANGDTARLGFRLKAE